MSITMQNGHIEKWTRGTTRIPPRELLTLFSSSSFIRSFTRISCKLPTVTLPLNNQSSEVINNYTSRLATCLELSTKENQLRASFSFLKKQPQ